MLKAAIMTGSIVATLAGTYLLGLQEPAAVETTVSNLEPVILIVPADSAANFQLPPTRRGTQVELRPIAQAIQPQIRPVARTRSSR